MPNHVTNILRIKNETAISQVNLLTKILDDKFQIDFNKIVPIPNSLKIESGSNTDNGIALLTETTPRFVSVPFEEWKEDFLSQPHIKNRLREILNQGQVAISNKEKYGAYTWYDFANINWGTKWNAYDQTLSGFFKKNLNKRTFKNFLLKQDDIYVSFDTAWSTPEPVLLKLSLQFPDVLFEVTYADEDIGENCGVFIIQNGKSQLQEIPKKSNGSNQSKEEFAFNIKHPNEDKRSHGYNEDWEYDENVEEAFYEEQKAKEKRNFKIKHI
jgi:hypothetical protein